MRTRLLLIGLALVALASTGYAATDCTSCHADVVTAMANDAHLRIKPFEVQGRTTGCEGCHGDGARHAETGDPSLIRNPEESTDWNKACLDCHATKKQGEWHASRHAAEGVGCTDCHKVHAAKKTSATAACATCHGDVKAKFQMPSRHPVREGHMTCASCHDVHSSNEAALRTKQRVNDLCFTCHQGKEGPFIFEHEPVQEDCRTCHDPHGTVANNLLVANEPTLCLQCHEMHFHAGYTASEKPLEFGGQERLSPYGKESFTIGFTTRCTQCHSKIHGSDLPSNGVSSRGRALTR